MIMEYHTRTRRWAVGLTSVALLGAAAWACGRSEQMTAVQDFNNESDLLQIACLDVNDDGRVDGSDAASDDLPDVTGNDDVDDADKQIVASVNIALPEGKPDECDAGKVATDWAFSDAPDADCKSGDTPVLVYAVGGGAVDLNKLDSAAGARWMLIEVGQSLSERDVPHQLASVAPSLQSTGNPFADAESWSNAFLTERLTREPCLQVILLGHSHGGATVTAVASQLEAAGFADRLLLSVLIDRSTALYAGDAASLPKQSPVVNFYLPAGASREEEGPPGAPINQPNVENIDSSLMQAPEHGEEGGDLVQVSHSTLDNSPEVLEQMLARVGRVVANVSGKPD
jgi:hypothetical protein